MIRRSEVLRTLLLGLCVTLLISSLSTAYAQSDKFPASTATKPTLEERIQRLETANRKLQAELKAFSGRKGRIFQAAGQSDEDDPPTSSSEGVPEGNAADDMSEGQLSPDTLPGERVRTPFDDQPEDIRTDEPAPRPKSYPTRSSFTDGFRWETEDGEYRLVFHNETQLDFRAYAQSGMDPTNQFGFYIPRMRLYFNGNLTEPIEYSVSVNKGLGGLDLLDAYLNFHLDDSLQVRLGRYRVPFTYDWFALSNQFLTAPERSLFANNYGYNRNFALMVHGEVLKDSAEYAVAVANGPRNQFFDFNGGKDLLSYLNLRPFMHVDSLPALKHFNVGGSLAYGIQSQDALPYAFRTSVNASESEGTFEAAPSFLELNPSVMERGARSLWELHMAWYYKQFTLITAWDAGYNRYSLTANSPEIQVPTHGNHIALGYFLTGEEITRRTIVEPLRPFRISQGQTGTGAIEVQARYSAFSVGNNIFSGGLANANLWTNRVYAIDAGVNWYLNRYLKIYFDWQHSVYGNPVRFRPGGFTGTSDLFWLRTQIYF